MVLLGIDVGSSVAKVALYDLDGTLLCMESQHIPTLQPQPEWVERDMNAMWSQTASAIQAVLKESRIDPAGIAAIGCTGHGNGLYLLDKSGQPLGNAIQSIDTRGSNILKQWSDDGILDKLRPYTRQQSYPAQTITLLAWMRDHNPEMYEQIGNVLLCKDYINYCLTGEIATDLSDMSTTSLLDVSRQQYSDEIFSLVGLQDIADKLPPLASSLDVIGQVSVESASKTGLIAGTPVIAGMIDITASAIGTGTITSGQACIVAGTWSINQVIAEHAFDADDIFLNSIFADPSLYLVLEGSPTSTTNLEWFIEQFCYEEKQQAEQEGVSVYDICNQAVAETDIEQNNIIFHPFLYGSNIQPNARAGFFGVAGWHTRQHMLRAVYEGIVFGHLSHINTLRHAGAEINVARLTGGAAKSEIWSQMFADILDTPLEVCDATETGTKGVALAAGVGAGVYADLVEAVSQGVHVVETYHPIEENTAIYLKRYEAYQMIAQAMCNAWDFLA